MTLSSHTIRQISAAACWRKFFTIIDPPSTRKQHPEAIYCKIIYRFSFFCNLLSQMMIEEEFFLTKNGQLWSGMTQIGGLLRGLQIQQGLFIPLPVCVCVCVVCAHAHFFFVPRVFCHSLKPAEIAQSCVHRQNDSSGVPNRFSADSVGVTATDASFVH